LLIKKQRFMMKKIISQSFFIGTVLITCLLIANSVFAEDSLKDIIAKHYAEEKEICPVVKKTILQGMDIKEITRTCVQMGHDVCMVVKCAVEANGNLEQIITGALEAGATSDVVSRCAIDGGADPKNVAKVFETGLGYSPPLAVGLAPVEISFPGGTPGGGSISPSVP
jgi:hypothetical protein